MTAFFSKEVRRNPYPTYDKLRVASPVLREPNSGLWLLLDYESVKRGLTDYNCFSSKHGPSEWMIFLDPPAHTKLRAFVSEAFRPGSIARLEHRIDEISRQLLDRVCQRGEMDLVADFSTPFPMAVIAEILGVPASDSPRFTNWNDAILNMSHTIPARAPVDWVVKDYAAATAEMDDYLQNMLTQRRAEPRDDMLTHLANAESQGERLSHREILGFFQLLLLAGSETTTNLLNNAILSFIENPDQLSRVLANPELLPSAIEEVLRHRSPLQWMFRVSRCEVRLHDQIIPEGNLVLCVIGSANRDPKQFLNPQLFDVSRNPNPHIAFGHGVHFCLGAVLARLEARIALTQLITRLKNVSLANPTPWEPRKGLHVHGPENLPIRFDPS